MDYKRAVEAVIVRANRVLLLQRKSGNWQFVTGPVNPNETPEDALIRKIKEETALTDVRVVKELASRKMAINDQLINIVSYLVASNSVAVEVKQEHIDYKWVRLDEASKQLQYEDQKAVIEKAMNALSGVYEDD